MLLACGAYRSRTCADLLCSVLGYGPGSFFANQALAALDVAVLLAAIHRKACRHVGNNIFKAKLLNLYTY